ncbi:MAG: MerC domain-containing protein [Gemmatimonadota bacterium]
MIKSIRLSDSAGVFGAIFAALCCAGVPIVVGALSVVGLSFVRKDAILWPLMSISLIIALWGFWKGRQFHGGAGPFLMATVAAVMLVAGVVFIHGPPAMTVIWVAVVALIVATVWNVSARISCQKRLPS